MTVSTKPYLIRAVYEWCVDQGLTPYVAAVVDANTRVPAGYAQDGQIVLNLSPEATNGLQMGNDLITFQARFGGVAQAISIPAGNVVAVYARENGHGMAFELEGAQPAGHEQDGEADSEAPASGQPPAGESEEKAPPASGKGGHLRIIK